VNAALLDELLAGYVAPVRVAFAAPTPAKAANPAKDEHPCGPAPASASCEGLRIPAKAVGAGDEADADSQNFAGIRRGQPGPRSEDTCGSSQDSQNSQGVAGATRCDANLAAAVAWTDADISAFLNRRARLLRWGWAEPEAEKLAERLVKRDRDDADDRVSCADCGHYRSGRCGNHRHAGLISPELGRDLAVMLQRCSGFQPSR
jgi:hypothetical protein